MCHAGPNVHAGTAGPNGYADAHTHEHADAHSDARTADGDSRSSNGDCSATDAGTDSYGCTASASASADYSRGTSSHDGG